MEIKTIGATPSKRNQLGNVHTVGWESRSITTQSFISHLVCRKRWSQPLCFVQLQFTRIYIGDTFFQIQGYRWQLYHEDIEKYH